MSAVLPVPPGADDLHHGDAGARGPGGVERPELRPAAEEVLGPGGEVAEVDVGLGRRRLGRGTDTGGEFALGRREATTTGT